MITSITSNTFNPRFKPTFSAQGNNISQVKKENSENSAKKDSFSSKLKNMSPELKTCALFGVGIALIAIGLLLKKPSKSEEVVDSTLKNMLETPQEFNREYLTQLIETMKKEANLKSGDAIYCIPKDCIESVFGQNTQNVNKIWDYLKMSENGFIVAPAHNTNGVLQINDFSEFKLVDPKTNTMLAFVNEIKNGRSVPFLL